MVSTVIQRSKFTASSLVSLSYRSRVCLEAQQQALAAAGAVKVFAEELSGASAANRRELATVLSKLQQGDVLLVTRLGRLARSTRDLLNVLDAVSKAGAAFRSPADVWADTSTAHGRLMLTVLGGLAEFERELIKTRTSEGRVRAKARGVHMGRHSALNQNQQREAMVTSLSFPVFFGQGQLPDLFHELRVRLPVAILCEAGHALTDIARTFGVSHTTIARSRYIAPQHDLGRRRGIAEIDNSLATSQGEARDPYPTNPK